MSHEKNSRALMLTILLISLIQMSHLAITPGIDLITTHIFPEKSLQTVQAAMSLPNIFSVVSGVIAALLVKYRLISKRSLVLYGLTSVALTGVFALVIHSRFWHLCFFNILIGLGMGAYIPGSQSIMFDNFDEKRRQFLSGTQAAFINCGGIIMSVVGGILTTRLWYGGHLVMLMAIPVLIVSLIVLPRDDKKASGTQEGKSPVKMPRDVYYYAFLVFIFMIMYNVGAMNLSTHLAIWNIGNSATAGVATALMMAGGAVSGFAFPKVSPVMRENIFPFSFLLMSISFTLLSLFPTSLPMTFIAMFICGSSLSFYVPRCVFCVSNLTDPSNSALATLFLACFAPGSGSFLSPVIMTNITYALGGNSTRFRYQFTGIVCVVIAGLLLLNNKRREKRALFEKEA